MPLRKTHDIVATIGKFKDRATGDEKKRYLNVGTLFTDEQDRLTIKIEAMPIGLEWSGWLSCYPVERNNQRDRDHAYRTQQPPPRDDTAGWDSNEPAQDIPF